MSVGSHKTLSPEEKERIIKLLKNTTLSENEIARRFECSNEKITEINRESKSRLPRVTKKRVKKPYNSHVLRKGSLLGLDSIIKKAP